MRRTIRRALLPAGWYPRDAGSIAAYMDGLALAADSRVQAVIAPHAGWFFSGRLAGLALAALPPHIETVVIAGGHLPRSAPVLFAEEDAVETPLGLMEIDGELRDAVQDAVAGEADCRADNTVEVLLPAARYFFPHAKLLWLRLPAHSSALETGGIIAEKAAALGRSVAVIGSTDLTHYGANYGFMPQGSAETALHWVKTVNDRRFIDAVLEGSAEEVLSRAENEGSACSAGAVLCALGFTRSFKVYGGAKPARKSAHLLAYTTSADVLREAGEAAAPDSFVGYAALSLE